MTLVVHTLFVVLAILDTLSAQLATQVIAGALTLALPPALDNTEHLLTCVTSSIFATITQGRMVEDTVDDTVDGALGISTLVIPAFDDLWHGPLDDLRSDLASWLVQNIAEVVLCI